MHIPVLIKETLEYLGPKRGDIILDGTIGCAGHAKEILDLITPGGKLIGLDRDSEAIKVSGKMLSGFDTKSYTLIRENFKFFDSALDSCGIGKVNGILLDLGVSSMQLDTSGRGFSIMNDGPLDMRMDERQELTASYIVNKYKEKDLADVIWRFGGERFSRRIARYISEYRKRKRIETTGELKDIVNKAVGYKYRKQKIQPATRTFQAIRIAVNDEMNNLNGLIAKLIERLMPGGRICMISFHSLEDRQVKVDFREFSKLGRLNILTKKPVTAKDDEIKANPRSRSAKLRAAELIG